MHKKCLVTKLFHLLHSILENHEELKLSDGEVGKVRDLKIKTKKDLIKDSAEIEVLAVDIISKLYDEKIDSAEINKLLEKKYDLKRESMKKLVEAFLTVKKMLSKEQMKKLKDICKDHNHNEQQEKETSCCR